MNHLVVQKYKNSVHRTKIPIKTSNFFFIHCFFCVTFNDNSGNNSWIIASSK